MNIEANHATLAGPTRDKIRDTAFSLERNFLIEVMRRSSGFIAVNVGIAGGAAIISIPEFPIDTDSLSEKIKNQHGKNKRRLSSSPKLTAPGPGHSFELAQQIKEKRALIIAFRPWSYAERKHPHR